MCIKRNFSVKLKSISRTHNSSSWKPSILGHFSGSVAWLIFQQDFIQKIFYSARRPWLVGSRIFRFWCKRWAESKNGGKTRGLYRALVQRAESWCTLSRWCTQWSQTKTHSSCSMRMLCPWNFDFLSSVWYFAGRHYQRWLRWRLSGWARLLGVYDYARLGKFTTVRLDRK